MLTVGVPTLKILCCATESDVICLEPLWNGWHDRNSCRGFQCPTARYITFSGIHSILAATVIAST
jgi:hypothetical protein